MCGDSDGWTLIDSTKKGFNAKSALIGGVLLGGIGLVAGAVGKKKVLYICRKCSFQYEYDGEAKKDIPIDQMMRDKGYKDGGSVKVYIDLIVKATPDCPFCEKPQELFAKYNFNGGDYSFKCAQCFSEFRCNFTFGGKVKKESVFISNCGVENINTLRTGICDANVLIKDSSKIK